MICSGAPAASLAAGYEALRSGILESERAGGRFGLVLLLREGLGAWMAQARARPVTMMGEASDERGTAPPLVSDEVRADMVVVLASMVMTRREERCA